MGITFERETLLLNLYNPSLLWVGTEPELHDTTTVRLFGCVSNHDQSCARQVEKETDVRKVSESAL